MDEGIYWFDVGGLGNFKRFCERGHIYFRRRILEHFDSWNIYMLGESKYYSLEDSEFILMG